MKEIPSQWGEEGTQTSRVEEKCEKGGGKRGGRKGHLLEKERISGCCNPRPCWGSEGDALAGMEVLQMHVLQRWVATLGSLTRF